MRLTTLLMVFSLLGCASVPRPDVDGCIVNAPAKHRKCYNFANDYDSDGNLKPGAVASIRPNASIEDLNKAFVLDSANPGPDGLPDAIAEMKAYLRTLRQDYEACRRGQ